MLVAKGVFFSSVYLVCMIRKNRKAPLRTPNIAKYLIVRSEVVSWFQFIHKDLKHIGSCSRFRVFVFLLLGFANFSPWSFGFFIPAIINNLSGKMDWLSALLSHRWFLPCFSAEVYLLFNLFELMHVPTQKPCAWSLLNVLSSL